MNHIFSLRNNRGQVETVVLVVLGLAVLIGLLNQARQKQQQHFKELVETYEVYSANLTNNELIAEYYSINSHLREAEDRVHRYELGQRSAEQQGEMQSLGYTLGTLLGGGHPRHNVTELRKKRAILLTIIHQRGLALPID